VAIFGLSLGKHAWSPTLKILGMGIPNSLM
jgi:hypothetical protein